MSRRPVEVAKGTVGVGHGLSPSEMSRLSHDLRSPEYPSQGWVPSCRANEDASLRAQSALNCTADNSK